MYIIKLLSALNGLLIVTIVSRLRYTKKIADYIKIFIFCKPLSVLGEPIYQSYHREASTQ